MLLLWVLSLLFMTSFAVAETIHSELSADLVCTPYGDCEPCPADILHEPFCQPFGTRRVMHCRNGTLPAPPPPPVPPHSGAVLSMPDVRPPERPHSHEGETRAWASCGRIVAQERADFYEFLGCNLLFAALALFGVFTRARRMQTLHARQLAARIGLGRQ